MSAEYLTIAQIEAAYPNEWVLVSELTKGADGFALGGSVAGHDAQREAIHRLAMDLPPRAEFAVFYAGLPDSEVEFLL